MRFLFFIAVSLFASLCTSQESNYLVASIDRELLNNAHAVVRLDKMEVDIEASDKMRIASKRIVTVLSEKGNRYVHAYVRYEKNDKVNKLEAIVYDKNGKEIKKIKKNNFVDVSAIPGGTLYSDSRVLYLRHTPTTYPYTVEFTKEYTTPNTAFLPTWSFLDGYNVSTEKSEFKVMFPNDVPYRYKEVNFENHSIQSTENNNELSYVAKNLKAYKPEDMAPSFSEFAPMVKVALNAFHLEGVDGAASTWEDLGKWIYSDLIRDRDKIDPVTVSKIKELVKGVDDPKEKIQLVYDYVQNNTRYISVQMGIGGWMPISASEVDKVKYGDCKGLTNYTMALLKSIGIESYYTVVFAGEKIRNLDADFPSMQGNHAFLNIPIDGKDTWLECTSQLTPANYISGFTDDRLVLKVRPEGGEIIKTAKYTSEENHQFTSAEYTIDENGGMEGKLTINSKGSQYNNKFRLPTRTDKQKEEHYKEYWDYVNNLAITDVEFQNDKKNIAFQEKIKVTASDYASFSGDQLLFAPNAFNRNGHIPNRYRNRTRELLIQRGFMDEDEFEIHIPQGYRIEALFDDKKIENKFGEYSISIEAVEGNILYYKRKWLLKDGKYPKEDYKEYRSFLMTVARYDNSKIVLIKA